jgi:asparagine synthase (glutamine-hydrolysing)
MSRHCHRRIESDGRQPAHWPQLHSFSIGLATSPDLKAAKEVANYLGSVHHEYVFTPQEGIDALADVIYHLETFDVTTIRASTPMYLMARRIRATGVKMVLSGEGADEIFGGYLYFHKAPDTKEFHEENVRKVKQLHLYDCLRANKSMMAWGVEARVPFLDRRFMETALSFDVNQKMCKDEKGTKRVEKWVLRKAFDLAPPRAYLPESVLWRQKEQFSDGVGYTWIDSLKEHAEKEVSDQQMATAANRFPLKTPRTKEAYLYRSLFAKHYGDNGSPAETVGWQDSIACSSATALKWDASFQGRADASGRCVAGVHESAYGAEYVTASQDSGTAAATNGNKRQKTA